MSMPDILKIGDIKYCKMNVYIPYRQSLEDRHIVIYLKIFKVMNFVNFNIYLLLISKSNFFFFLSKTR